LGARIDGRVNGVFLNLDVGAGVVGGKKRAAAERNQQECQSKNAHHLILLSPERFDDFGGRVS
jgi:hypothetical protein